MPSAQRVGRFGVGETYDFEWTPARALDAVLSVEIEGQTRRLPVWVRRWHTPFSHPQVYVELSMANNVERRPAFHRFLRGIVDAGYTDRVMFGSDSMVWPGLIDAAVRGIEEATYLTPGQKRGIFYDNAALFLRLTPEQIARHHEPPVRSTRRK